MSSKYCWFCFSPKGSARACPYCGAIEGGRNREDQLQSGMELADRYVVGGASDGGNSGIIYLAVDLQDAGRLVRIKEFVPKEYARRSDLNYDIITEQVNNVKFEQRKNTILRQAGDLIRNGRYSDVFSANNTVYVVSPLKRIEPEVKEQAVEQEAEQQIGFVPSYRPECRPVPDTPEYIPPAAPSEPEQIVFEDDAPSYSPDFEAESSVRDFSSFAAEDNLGYADEYSQEYICDDEEQNFFTKIISALKFLLASLGKQADSLVANLSHTAFILKFMQLVDRILKKDNSFESTAHRNERAKKFSLGFVIAVCALLLLAIILICVL